MFAECPTGMVYQQCGSLCPRTCDNVEMLNCQSGCAAGCFCPDGQVMYNGRCVHPIVCPGIHVCTYVCIQFNKHIVNKPTKHY